MQIKGKLAAMPISSAGQTRDNGQAAPPQFDDAFRAALRDLILWRRDVRRFRMDPVDPALILSLIELAARSPSVGFSQPWRFVLVESRQPREAVRASFARANADALSLYSGERRGLYAKLKLEGLERAPVQIAVFADEETGAGAGLGSNTMPETLRYSVVGAIQTLWLAARAAGLGVGWVSILEPGTSCRGVGRSAGMEAGRLLVRRLAGRGAPRPRAGAPRLAGTHARRRPHPAPLITPPALANRLHRRRWRVERRRITT